MKLSVSSLLGKICPDYNISVTSVISNKVTESVLALTQQGVDNCVPIGTTVSCTRELIAHLHPDVSVQDVVWTITVSDPGTNATVVTFLLPLESFVPTISQCYELSLQDEVLDASDLHYRIRQADVPDFDQSSVDLINAMFVPRSSNLSFKELLGAFAIGESLARYRATDKPKTH